MPDQTGGERVGVPRVPVLGIDQSPSKDLIKVKSLREGHPAILLLDSTRSIYTCEQKDAAKSQNSPTIDELSCWGEYPVTNDAAALLLSMKRRMDLDLTRLSQVERAKGAANSSS